MVNFTDCPPSNKLYSGANGSKIGKFYNDNLYMLKFPIHKKNSLSYSNGVINEYIASKIYQSLGIDTQEVILGICKKDRKEYIVCACKDFTNTDEELLDFMGLKNQVLENGSGSSTDLNEILLTIQKQKIISKSILKKRFWDMFIADTLLGNFDRHNGNWGFLYNRKTNEIKLAPVFDCGSCLYPQISDETITSILANDKIELNKRIYDFPNSALRLNGQKINYYNFLTTTTNKDCIKSLSSIYKKINKKVISNIIDSTKPLTTKQKAFYKFIIQKRKELILDVAYNKHFENENTPIIE